MQILPGISQALGAHWDGEGVDFALFSANATSVELCLFEGPEGEQETHRLELPGRTGDVWHGRIPGLQPGQLYGYRVDGRWAPGEGHRFNNHKLLIDPYARALHGPMVFDEALFGHDPADPGRPSPKDSAPFVPRCVVVDPDYDWGKDTRPDTPWSRTVLYECHVKGTTARHPDLPERERGSFAGLSSPRMIEHLVELGVTAVELLPVHHAGVEEHLARRDLTNYWGYATIGFFAPDTRFARSASPAGAIGEFRQMVRALHEAGIEVILDVVYNHTPEGGPDGPTFSLRGIDNPSYYRTRDGDPGYYDDVTGTGHTLNAGHPRVRQMIVDSLRYWAEEMHVDGFRFDLATALARENGAFDPSARLFEIIQQDPVLSKVKLIAEPWDLGADGYRLGGFPLGWSEWNDRYRDVTRRFWRGDEGQRGALASCLMGSSDLFPGDRGSIASINYVCSHDGFTLEDLVSYSRKHNEANGERGRDGPHDESHNWGVEGPSHSRRVIKMRDRTRRNLVATLALSGGVPMWLGGDEIGRTQRGNNNAYCQDNEISWFDWALDPDDEDFLHFARHCFAVRAANAVYRRHRHLAPEESRCVRWSRPDGAPMHPADWSEPEDRGLALLLDASSVDPFDERGLPQERRTAMLFLNGEPRTRSFKLPQAAIPQHWTEVINTACPHAPREVRGDHVRLAPHSLVALELGAPT